MIVSRLLTPKASVVFVYDDFTVRQVIEKMQHHKFSAIPVIDRKGKYVGTISDGMLLWFIYNNSIEIDSVLDKNLLESTIISQIIEVGSNPAVNLATEINIVLDKAIDHNFLPIVDSLNNFSGIVTRKSVMQYIKKNDEFMFSPRLEF